MCTWQNSNGFVVRHYSIRKSRFCWLVPEVSETNPSCYPGPCRRILFSPLVLPARNLPIIRILLQGLQTYLKLPTHPRPLTNLRLPIYLRTLMHPSPPIRQRVLTRPRILMSPMKHRRPNIKFPHLPLSRSPYPPPCPNHHLPHRLDLAMAISSCVTILISELSESPIPIQCSVVVDTRRIVRICSLR